MGQGLFQKIKSTGAETFSENKMDGGRDFLRKKMMGRRLFQKIRWTGGDFFRLKKHSLQYLLPSRSRKSPCPLFSKPKKVSAPVLKPGVHTFCSSLREGERFYWVPEPGFRREIQAFFSFSKRGQTLFSAYDKGGHLLLFGY